MKSCTSCTERHYCTDRIECRIKHGDVIKEEIYRSQDSTPVIHERVFYESIDDLKAALPETPEYVWKAEASQFVVDLAPILSQWDRWRKRSDVFNTCFSPKHGVPVGLGGTEEARLLYDAKKAIDERKYTIYEQSETVVKLDTAWTPSQIAKKKAALLDELATLQGIEEMQAKK